MRTPGFEPSFETNFILEGEEFSQKIEILDDGVVVDDELIPNLFFNDWAFTWLNIDPRLILYGTPSFENIKGGEGLFTSYTIQLVSEINTGKYLQISMAMAGLACTMI